VNREDALVMERLKELLDQVKEVVLVLGSNELTLIIMDI